MATGKSKGYGFVSFYNKLVSNNNIDLKKLQIFICCFSCVLYSLYQCQAFPSEVHVNLEDKVVVKKKKKSDMFRKG